MARPIKDGLDYFSKDTDFYRDRKIRALIGRFGSDGAILYDYILCEVYGDKGYYTTVDDSFTDIAAADLGMTPEKIGLIMDYLLNKSMLLDGTLFKADKVLTSHGIQTRYQEAVRRRAQRKDIEVSGKLWLLNEAETESFIKVRHRESLLQNNPGFSAINPDKSAINSTKKSKVKKSKVKEKETPCDEPDDGFDAFWAAYPVKSGIIEQAYREYLQALREATPEQIMGGLLRQKPIWAGQEARYIPSAAKWLHNKGWTAEIKEVSKNGSGQNRYNRNTEGKIADEQWGIVYSNT